LHFSPENTSVPSYDSKDELLSPLSQSTTLFDYTPAMATVTVFETFTSIQGESSFAGLPCYFIRLAGCNLRCRYCDTPQAYGGGKERFVAELVDAWRASPAAIVEITGGEPLLQAGFAELASALRDVSSRRVLVETNGSRDLGVIPDGVIAVMDVKCPGSGEAAAMDLANIRRLRPEDEVKFVILDRADYTWAREFVAEQKLAVRCGAILFSPVWGSLDPSPLAEWILADGLSVRLQMPLHKVLGVR
jgi:7-carboxy-7-deazaguanine synthase